MPVEGDGPVAWQWLAGRFLMYAEFFRLERSPFTNTADPAFFFRTAEHEEALASLVYGVTQRRGLTVITGPPGCGKTLLAHMLMRTLDGQAQAALVLHAPESGHDLVATLCREFDVRHRAAQTTGELVERLHAHLCERFCEGKTAVAILDEAQNLSLDTLEHLRMLGNLERENAKLLQIVLLGQPELIGVLRLPQMRQLCQRVFCACQLRALDRDQTRSYVRHRLTIAGASERELFTDEAIDLLHDRSGGLPRMINQIADSALLLAYGASRPVVDRDTVSNALKEMIALYGEGTSSESGNDLPDDHSALVTDRSEGPAARQGVPVRATDELTSTVSQGLDERVRQGAEVAGRLGEVSRLAREQSADLIALVERAQSTVATLHGSGDALATARAEAVSKATKLARLVRRANRVARGLHAGQVSAQEQGDRLVELHAETQRSADLLAAELPEAVQTLDGRVKEARELLDEVLRGLADLTAATEQTQSIQERAQSAIDQAEGVHTALDRSCTAANQQRRRMVDLLHFSKNSTERLGQVTGKAEKTVDQLRFADGEVKAATRACVEATACLDERLANVRGEIADLQTSAEAARGVREALTCDIRALEAQLAASREERSAAQAAAIETREELARLADELGGRMRTAEDLLGESRTQIERLQEQFRDAVVAANRLTQVHEQAVVQAERLSEETSRASTVHQQLAARVSGAKEICAELTDTVASSRGQTDAILRLTERLDDLLPAVRRHMAEAEAAATQLGQLRVELTSEVLPTTHRELTERQAQAHAVLQAVAEQAELLERAIESARSACTETARNGEDLRGLNQSVLDSLASLQDLADTAARRVDEKVSLLDDRLEQVGQESATLMTRFEDSRSAAGELACDVDRQLARLREQVATSQCVIGELDGLRTQLAELTGPRAAELIDSHRATLDGSLAAAGQSANQLDQATAQAQVLAGRITEVLEQVRQAGESLSASRTAAEKLATQCGERQDALGARLDQAAQHSENLEGLVTRAEGVLAALAQQAQQTAEAREDLDRVARRLARERALAAVCMHRLVSMRSEAEHNADGVSSVYESSGRDAIVSPSSGSGTRGAKPAIAVAGGYVDAIDEICRLLKTPLAGSHPSSRRGRACARASTAGETSGEID